MACLQLVAVVLKLILAHLQTIFEKNSESVGASSISESAVQQDTKYILQVTFALFHGAKEKFQFTSTG